MPGWHHGQTKTGVPPPSNSQRFNTVWRCESDCVPGKAEHTGVGTFSGAKAKPESVIYYNNTKYGEDVPDQMRGRVRKRRYRKMANVLYNILDLAGLNARILFKQHQRQDSPEESPAAAGRGAEGKGSIN